MDTITNGTQVLNPILFSVVPYRSSCHISERMRCIIASCSHYVSTYLSLFCRTQAGYYLGLLPRRPGRHPTKLTRITGLDFQLLWMSTIFIYISTSLSSHYSHHTSNIVHGISISSASVLTIHGSNLLHGSNCPFRHDRAVMIANLPLTTFICINERIAALNCRAVLECKLVNT